MAKVEKQVEQADKRFGQMKAEAQDNWTSSWEDLRDYVNPTRGHFEEEANVGEMIDHQRVLDGYATLASEVLASGLLSGMTSPSRPWFKLSLDDEFLNELPGVREWLDDSEKRVRTVLNQSNVYQVLYGTYKELGTFGTGCFMLLEDFDDVVRAHSYTAGEYYLGTDSRGRVDSFAREYWMTVEQIVKEFGLDSVSGEVLSNWNNNQRLQFHKVRHLIEKNDFEIEGLPNDKEYRSLYWLGGNKGDGFLGVRGFDRFPVLAPRWETVTTHQVYGKGPGWHALGDVKQLQKTMDDKLKLQEKLHNPPVTADSDIEGFINLVPGGVTRTSFNVPDAGVRPAYVVPNALESFIEMENKLKGNIDNFFFKNLFLMLINIDKRNMTATEVAERQQEKVMMMGPILHRLQEELLDPMIDLVFGMMFDAGLLLPPPVELEGQDLGVKYISILSQAQEALSVVQIDRVLERIIAVAQLDPSIIDNLDVDALVREVREMEGAPARMVRKEEEVAEIREARQQQEQMAQMAQVGKDGGSAMKSLAEANQIAEGA